MDRSFYNEVELAVHSTTLDRVCELADVLGVPVADLVSSPGFQVMMNQLMSRLLSHRILRSR